MLEIIGLNYVAILAAWVINIGIGSFWYSPKGFGKLWSKLSGVDMMKLPKDEANRAIIAVSVASLIQTLALAVILNSLHVESAIHGLLIGLVLWAGFTAATTVGNNLYSRLSWKFWWLNASFFLLIMALNSIVLTIWR